MRNIHHLPPLKRAKHRITADLHDFLTFPGTDGRIAADLDGPFRDTVKAFLEIHAWPAHGFVSEKYGLRTWRMMFRVGEAVETVVELVVTEEDVSRSRSIVNDVSRKFGMEYRLLHAVVTGHPWYGEWGYEFRDGSFALTDNEYQKAVETLSSIPLSIFFNYNRQSRRRLQNIIVFYWTLSGHTLGTLRDLFTSGVLFNNDLEQQVETAAIKILKAVGSTKWVTAHSLRGAVCRRAKSPDVMDHFLQTLHSLQTAPTHPLPDTHPKPTAEHILRDLKFLYHSLLDPSSMESYKPKMRRESALSAARTVLDCKRLIKDYDEGSAWLSSNPFAFTVWCHVKANGNIAPPQEPVQLPLSGTIADLRHEATKAFQETYVIFKGFQPKLLLDYEWIDDNFQVKNLIGFNSTARLEGKCFDEQRLADFKRERGTDKWVVDCTRCLGFHDFEKVPAQFTCKKCISNHRRPVRRPRGRPRTRIPDAYKCKGRSNTFNHHTGTIVG